MSNLKIQPPQYKIPGNLPKGLTSALDPNKLKQLSPAQLDAIKNLPPEKLASLNNIPIDQIKNLDPRQLADKVSKLPNSNDVKNKLNTSQKQVNNVIDEQKKKIDDLKKSTNNPTSYIKEQANKNSKDAKNQLTKILLPVLLKFIRAENIADILIKRLEKDTKKQLQNKGKLVVSNGSFIFTPSNSNDYSIYKQNFDRRVNNIKKSIESLKQIITTLENVIKYINFGLSAIKIYIKIKTKIVLAQEKAVQAELSSPTPGGAKPLSGQLLPKINKSLKQLPKDEEKIKTYQAALTAAQAMLVIFKDMLRKIQIKLNNLNFTISSNPNTSLAIDGPNGNPLTEASKEVPTVEDYVSSNGKEYTLSLIILPNGSRQYQALDAFSKMKITQTAPSKSKSNQELLDEIKQILG